MVKVKNNTDVIRTVTIPKGDLPPYHISFKPGQEKDVSEEIAEIAKVKGLDVGTSSAKPSGAKASTLISSGEPIAVSDFTQLKGVDSEIDKLLQTKYRTIGNMKRTADYTSLIKLPGLGKQRVKDILKQLGGLP